MIHSAEVIPQRHDIWTCRNIILPGTRMRFHSRQPQIPRRTRSRCARVPARLISSRVVQDEPSSRGQPQHSPVCAHTCVMIFPFCYKKRYSIQFVRTTTCSCYVNLTRASRYSPRSVLIRDDMIKKKVHNRDHSLLPHSQVPKKVQEVVG